MRRYYTQSEKSKILKEFLESGLSASAFSRKVGVSASSLCKWKREQSLPEEAFIELGVKEPYELKIGEVILKVPGTESVQKISKLVRALQC